MTDSEVLTHVGGLIQGQLTLSEFENWFLLEALDGDTPLIRRVSAILAESAGNVSDDVVTRQLRALLPVLTVSASALSGGVVVFGYDADDFPPGSTNITEPQEYSVA